MKHANAALIPSSTLTDQSRKNTKITQRKQGLEKSNKLSVIGQIGGLVRVEERPVRTDGSEPGKRASVKMSTGKMLSVKIKTDQRGIATVPLLTPAQWQSVDEEIRMSIYDNPLKYKITDKFENDYAPALAQARAALVICEWKALIELLMILKLQKPTQKMDTTSMSVFLETFADLLISDGYSFFSIAEGIKNFLKRSDDKYFPNYKTLNGYIYPIHYKLKRRADKLEEMILRRHLSAVEVAG